MSACPVNFEWQTLLVNNEPTRCQFYEGNWYINGIGVPQPPTLAVSPATPATSPVPPPAIPNPALLGPPGSTPAVTGFPPLLVVPIPNFSLTARQLLDMLPPEFPETGSGRARQSSQNSRERKIHLRRKERLREV